MKHYYRKMSHIEYLDIVDDNNITINTYSKANNSLWGIPQWRKHKSNLANGIMLSPDWISGSKELTQKEALLMILP